MQTTDNDNNVEQRIWFELNAFLISIILCLVALKIKAVENDDEDLLKLQLNLHSIVQLCENCVASG